MKHFLIIILLLSSCSSNIKEFPDLALGEIGLEQEEETTNLRPGLKFIEIKRGHTSQNDYYTLSSGVISKTKADRLQVKLRSLGYLVKTEYSPEKDPHGQPLGVIVRTGRFNGVEDVEKKGRELQKQGINMAIRHTSEDGNITSGPFQISLLEIDLNEFTGKMKAALSLGRILGNETTSGISKRNNAIAAVNAGFFAWDTVVGLPGDPAGISIVNGRLLSEGIEGRAALVIRSNDTTNSVLVAHNVKTSIKLSLQDTVFTVNGFNRALGKVLNCGNKIGSSSELPIHDFVCMNENEIVVFTPEFDSRGAAGKGLEIAVDRTRKVISISNQRGGEIPQEGFLVQAIGEMGALLGNHIKIGERISIESRVTSDEGEIKLTEGVYTLNGGPTLLRNGQMCLSDRYREGWETQFENDKVTDEFVDKKDKAALVDDDADNRFGFYHGWVVRRHPRTAIGLTHDNKVYVAVVYGRQPGVSSGANITEMAEMMKRLGAIEAFNLDGGGSSMMLVDGKRTGNSSDATGEREVGDALIFTD